MTLLPTLRAIVGEAHVLTDEESRERASFDAVGRSRLAERAQGLLSARVDAVVRPGTTEEVAAVVRAASEAGIAAIPYGGGTGVMGGVVPVQGGLSLDLRRMDRIVEMRAADRIAWAQPAVVLADLDAVAAEHGLMLGHDPWSTPIATVGGAISTDSVGYRASRYGSMGAQVRAVEAVLGDGTVVKTKPVRMQSSGPQLPGLFVGAEGTMGVITQAAVQLFAQPEERAFATVGFDSFERGHPLVCRLFGLGLAPALVDLTEEEPGELAQGYRCLLYLGFEGYREEVRAQRERALAEGLAAGGTDLGPSATERYWTQRHATGYRWRASVAHLRPTERWAQRDWRGADYLHVSLPLSRVVEFKRHVEEVARERELEVAEVAVWTHPELFSVLLRDPAVGRDGSAYDGANLRDAVHELLEVALRMEGGIEYCHGSGVKLDPYMPQEWGDALVLARRLKQAADPTGTLNPGKLGL